MMFVFWGRAAQLGVGQEACGKARQDKRKAPYCWARDIMEGHTGRLPHICVQQSWRKYQSTQRKEKRKDALLSRIFFSPNKYSHICNWNLPRQFLPKSVQIVPKLITLFWKKCWNQLHKFGRNVEINDMVLEEMWKSMTWFWKRRNGVNSVEQRRQWCRERAINLWEV